MQKMPYLSGAVLLLSLFASGASAESLPWDEVAVTFKEPVGDRFVGVINVVMGTETVKKITSTRYRFHIGDKGDQNEWAIFFSSLPYVKSVEPLPKISEYERDLPDMIMPIDRNTRGNPSPRPTGRAATGPGGAPSPRPSVDNGGADSNEPDMGNILYMSPRQIVGNTLLVRYQSDGPTPDVINQVFGTKSVGRSGDDMIRLTLPPGMTPMVAARIFQLCPWVAQAEPSYGR
jgi:hypothetical protein